MIPRKIEQGQLPVREVDEDEQQPRTAAASPQGYDSIKPGSSSSEIPQGRYEAIVRGVTMQEPNDHGQSIRVNFEICSDAFAGTSVPTWFKIYQPDGTIVPFAVELWKRMLARLGYEDVLESELPQLLDQISADMPGAVIKVSYQKSKKDGNTYQRVEVDQPCDNAVIQRYKEDNIRDDIPY
jgi:hypothetical protein